MSIRVIVNGAQGRMGQAAVKAIEQDESLLLAGQTGRHDDLKAAIHHHHADVVVELTNAEVVYHNTQVILEAGAHPVIGASGLLPEQIAKLQAQSAMLNRGGVIAPNFSLGAILMMKYAKEIAGYFNQVEIIEMHHDGKLDSPSGTAVRTAEMLAEVSENRLKAAKPQIETLPGARGACYQNIPIHSIRLPGLVAHQQVIFGGSGETLTLKHDTIDRQCFMPGIRLACKKVIVLKELVYGLEHLL